MLLIASTGVAQGTVRANKARLAQGEVISAGSGVACPNEHGNIGSR